MLYLRTLLALGALASARNLGQTPLKHVRDATSTPNADALFGLKLRILPLGASITYGYHSNSGNGYRLDLEQMIQPFADVTYIGSQCSGTMRNGNNEGHPGFVISQMEGVSAPDLPQRPNVILLYVGTNDMLYPVDPDNAPQRMGQLVQYLAKACPDAAIIVGNLFIETDPVVQARIDKFNHELPAVIDGLQKQGIKTIIADMSHALTKSDLFCDGEHPIDRGYQKMADVFFKSIVDAAVHRLLQNPVKTNVTSTVHCTPLSATGAGTCSSTATTTTTSTTKNASYPTTTSAHATPTKSASHRLF